MGLKQIAALRKGWQDYEEEVKSVEVWATRLKDLVADIDKARKQMWHLREQALKEIRNIKLTDPDIMAISRKLHDSFSNPTLPLPSFDDLHARIRAKKREVEFLEAQWMKKAEASWPKSLNMGMLLKWSKSGKIYEVVSGPHRSNNPKYKGDEALFYKLQPEGGSANMYNNISPKFGWKYIKV